MQINELKRQNTKMLIQLNERKEKVYNKSDNQVLELENKIKHLEKY
jgi:hypothetical protein